MTRQEHAHSINGVPGRMFTVHDPEEVRGRLVYRNQKWVSEGRPIDGYGTNGVMHVTVRFDDECKNGRMSFSITADVYTQESRRRRDTAGGCMHDEITRVFPELAPFAKWHLVSTDGPMHYAANTCYHAGNRDCNGRAAGEPSSWGSVIYFADSPVPHGISDKFAEFLEGRRGTGDFNIHEVPHKNEPGGYKFAPKYTFAGYGEQWHDCPFDDRATAEAWQRGINSGNWRIERIATAFSDGKKRDLDAARSCAVWPEATDEELGVECDELRVKLLARLPALIAAFRADVEAAGFFWEPEQEVNHAD